MKAKYYVRSLMFISLFLGQGVMAAPAYFRSVASGNWSSLSTWQQSADNVTWVSATEYPLQTGSTNTITLQSPYTVTLDVSLSYALSALTINSGATLKDISTTPTTSFSTSSLTISGTINFTYNNVYLKVNNGTINASASLTGYRLYFSGGTLTNNGTITALGSPGCIDSQVLGSTTFAGTGTFNFNGLSIHNNSTLTSNISGVFNESCVFNIYSGSFVAGASSTAVYNLTAINNVVTSIFNTSNINNTKQVIIGGNVTNNGTFTAGSATTKNSTLSGASNIQFNDTLKVNTGFETKNSGTVTVSTMLTGAGAFTQNTNSTLNYGGATLLIAALNATATGNTVNYFASANQTIANFSYYNLTLSGTTNKTKSLSGPGTILGTVSIQNNSIFSCGGFDLSVGGDWNNSSTNTNAFVASTKSVTFNGSSSQNIINSGSANGTRFNNLIINNISPSIPQISLSLSGNPLTILNSLNMISGVVNYNSNSVQLGSTSASANTLIHSGSASSGWFYTTNASGSFLRYFQTGVAVANGSLLGLLPVGTSTDFRPIYISCPTTPPTTNTTMKVTQVGASTTTTIVNIADPPGSNIVRQYQGSWPIVPNTTTGTYNITAGGTGFGTIGNVSDLRLSLAASVVGTAGTNSGTTTFPLVLRTGLSPANLTNTFYLGSVDATNSPLPVELVFFEGKVNGGVVDLEWQTRSEVNCESFTVLRSIDGKNFLPVGSVDGHGTTNRAHHFHIQDPTPNNGNNYYRLVQTDFDGASTILKTVAVALHFGGVRIAVFPNPISIGTSVTMILTGLAPQTAQEVLIIDLQGRVQTSQRIVTDESGSFRGQIKVDLEQGLYILKVNSSASRILIY